MAKRATKRSKKTKRVPKSLLVSRLENVSKKVFKEYYTLITELIGDSPGIYALYDETELYYVGKSTDLRKRIRHHLRDRHYASWTHFSLYLVRRDEHIDEIESLIIRIANPKGNRVIPKGRTGGQMLKKLKAMIKQEQKRRFAEMFGEKTKGKVKKLDSKTPKSLKGLVQRKKKIYRTYKGKDYKATLTPGGKIKLGNKLFTTPTAAAKAVTGWRTINGWTFWYIRNKDGELVRLSDHVS